MWHGTVVVPIEYQVLPPMCTICHVFGHPSTRCAKSASTSSIPLQSAKQEWVQVQNGKSKGVQLSSCQHQSGPLLSNPSCSGPHQVSLSAETTVQIEENQSDSEGDLIVVQEGVVSSSNEATTLIQQPKHAELNLAVSGPETVASWSGPSPAADVQISGKGVNSNSQTVARQQITPQPPDLQNAMFKEKATESVTNTSLSKSALKRMRKQLKEQPRRS